MDNKKRFADVVREVQRQQKITWRDFTSDTTVHGVKYIFGEGHRVRRYLWIVIVVSAIIAFGVQVADRLTVYLRHDSSINVEVKYQKVLAFPAVTICNLNVFKTTAVHKLKIYRALDTLYSVKKLSDGLAVTLKTDSLNASEIFYNTTHDLEDFVESCKWKGNECNLTTDFVQTFNELGICYMFTPMKQDGVTRNNLIDKSGSKSGLELILNVEQYEHMKGPQSDAGVKMILHDHSEKNLLEENGFSLAPGTHSSVSVKQKYLTSLQQPWGNCVPAPPNALTTCLARCRYHETIQRCGCSVPYISESGLSIYNNSVRSCSPKESFLCSRGFALPSEFNFTFSGCECHAPCKRYVYHQQTSSAYLSTFNVENVAVADASRKASIRDKFMAARETSQRVNEIYYRPDQETINEITKVVEEYLIKIDAAIFRLQKGYRLEKSTRLLDLINNGNFSSDKLFVLQHAAHIVNNFHYNPTERFGTETTYPTYKLKVEEFFFHSNGKNGPFDKNVEKCINGNFDNDHDKKCNPQDTTGYIGQKIQTAVPVLTGHLNNIMAYVVAEKAKFLPAVEVLLQDSNKKASSIAEFGKCEHYLDEWIKRCNDSLSYLTIMATTSNITAVLTSALEIRDLSNRLHQYGGGVEIDKNGGGGGGKSGPGGSSGPSASTITLKYTGYAEEMDSFAECTSGRKGLVNKLLNPGKQYGTNLLCDYKGCSERLKTFDMAYNHGISDVEGLEKQIDRVVANLNGLKTFLTNNFGRIVSNIKKFQRHAQTKHELAQFMQKRSTDSILTKLTGYSEGLENANELSMFIKQAQSSMERVYQQIESSPIPLLTPVLLNNLSFVITGKNRESYDTELKVLLNTSNTDKFIPRALSATFNPYTRYLDNDFNKMFQTSQSVLVEKIYALKSQLQSYLEEGKMNSQFYLRNFLKVNVFYEELSFEKVTQTESFTPVAFLSEVGGFLGLLLGASTLTFVEFLDFIIMRAIQRNRNGKNTAPSPEKKKDHINKNPITWTNATQASMKLQDVE